jgi:hypothetical protein
MGSNVACLIPGYCFYLIHQALFCILQDSSTLIPGCPVASRVYDQSNYKKAMKYCFDIELLTTNLKNIWKN